MKQSNGYSPPRRRSFVILAISQIFLLVACYKLAQMIGFFAMIYDDGAVALPCQLAIYAGPWLVCLPILITVATLLLYRRSKRTVLLERGAWLGFILVPLLWATAFYLFFIYTHVDMGLDGI